MMDNDNDLNYDQADSFINRDEFIKNNRFFDPTLGRTRKFKSPEQLWKLCLQYFEWCDNNPLAEHDFVGRNGKSVLRYKVRPYTWNGLELYLGITDDGLMNYRKNERYKEFFGVLSHVEKIIYNQKFTAAAAGMLNPNFIARELGLADKQETKHSVDEEQIEVFKIGDKIIKFGGG